MNQIHYTSSDIKGVEIKRCNNSLHAYKDHLHQELSIGYIEKGSTILCVNGVDYPVSQGEAIVIHPYVSHRCQPQDLDNWQFTMMYIQESFCQGLELQMSIGIKKLKEADILLLKELMAFFLSDASHFEKENRLVAFLPTILNCDTTIYFGNDAVIGPVRDYIQQHFLGELSLELLEQVFGINKFQLIREFRRRFNTTPSIYQLQLKIDYAKSLLQNGTSLTWVAQEAGFYDLAHFSKEFKKAYGITPTAYCGDL